MQGYTNIWPVEVASLRVLAHLDIKRSAF